MDPFTMVVAIVGITAFASVLRAKYKVRRHADGDDVTVVDADTTRLREELRTLKERVAVLERIATDGNRGVALDREIEALRDRDATRL